jgi:N-acetylated-alpha-linked acidic dipeptidase
MESNYFTLEWAVMKALLWGLVCCALSTPVRAQSDSLRGFFMKDVSAQRLLEQQVQAVPETGRLRKYMELLAAEPHSAGSARSKAVAEYLQRSLREWGLDAQIEQFEALMPLPVIRLVEVVGPKPFVATLQEPTIMEDPNSSDANELPSFSAYGASGEVTGEVVYVNFGAPADYAWLARQGIDVKGKIVIARYGRIWRGSKPKLAAEHGAIACLLYSDPHEDGYFEGDIYPKGPMRPAGGVQRGSVLDVPLYPGDPLSPGWASEKGTKRLAQTEAKSLVKIPVLPISYGDAQPILEQLTGPEAPLLWRGALPITYHLGPGATRVHMKTDYDWSTRPLYDVIATIPGSDFPDEWVIAGNHHDAWVNGAEDPVSGVAALLETARALGALQKQGWKPKRTIKIALWDGEEFGLLGSTEWAEKHQYELKRKAVAYLNSDHTGKGWIQVSGSHSLEAFASEVASAVPQPGGSGSLLDASLANPIVPEGEEAAPPQKQSEFSMGALGAGSDYAAFLDFLGIASMNAGFAGQSKGGVYHSAYDSIYWYSHFADGSFADGRALAQYTATALLRLANASVLPFEFSHFANTVSAYVDDIQSRAQRRGQTLEFGELHRQLEQLRQNGTNLDALTEAAMFRDSIAAARLSTVNQALMRSERTLTQREGLPNRGWYKHQIYAPGFYTGYDVKTVPGVREAVDGKDWVLAQKETEVVRECLERLNQAVSVAIGGLSGI